MKRRRASAVLQVNFFLTIWGLLQLLLALPLLYDPLRQAAEQLLRVAAAPDRSTTLTDPLDALAAAVVSGSPVGLGLAASSLVAALLAVWAMQRFAGGPSLQQLGLGLNDRWRPDLLVGLALGPLLFLTILLLELALGWASVGAGQFDPAAFLLALLTFVAVGAAEELLIRGYTLQVLERAWGTRSAVGASAAIFALLHLGNPAAGWTAIVGLVAAGLLFAYAYLTTRALWLPIGLHFSWNFSEGPLFGFPVSGLAGQGLLVTQVRGPQLATGGSFGPEAGLVGLLAVLLALLVISLWGRRRARTGALAVCLNDDGLSTAARRDVR